MTTTNEISELRKMMEALAVRVGSLASRGDVEDAGGVVPEVSSRAGASLSGAGSSVPGVVEGDASRGEQLVRAFEQERGFMAPGYPGGVEVHGGGSSSRSESSVEFVDAEVAAAVAQPGKAVSSLTFGYFDGAPQVREVVASDGRKHDVSGATGGGLMKRYVNSASARGAREALSKGGVLPSARMSGAFAFDFALSLYAAGSVPDFFLDGRRRLRALAAVGDAAITLVVVARGEEMGSDVASVQSVRGTALSNGRMSQAIGSSDLRQFVVLPAGVSLEAKSGADALEAIAGALYKHRGLDAVRRFIQWVRLV